MRRTDCSAAQLAQVEEVQAEVLVVSGVDELLIAEEVEAAKSL